MTPPDFFRACLKAMIDLHHPLTVLATRMAWAGIESALAPCFAHKDRKERSIAGLDLFAPALHQRMRRVLKRQRTIPGRVMRDLKRRLPHMTRDMRQIAGLWLKRTRHINSRRPKGTNKLHALQAPEIECIGKGKARQPYGFGAKIGVATRGRGNLIAGARAFPGNPCDGHTLAGQIDQAAIRMQNVKGVPKPHIAIVDLGYRGVDVPRVETIHRGRIKRLSAKAHSLLKRRQAVKPAIGHLKDDCSLTERVEGIGRGRTAPGTVCRWLQPALVDAGRCPSGAESPFCVLNSGSDAWMATPRTGWLVIRQADNRSKPDISRPAIYFMENKCHRD